MKPYCYYYLEGDNPRAIKDILDKHSKEYVDGIKEDGISLPKTIAGLVSDLLSFRLIRCDGAHAGTSGGAAKCQMQNNNTGCGHGNRLFHLLKMGANVIGYGESSITHQPTDFSMWSKFITSTLTLDRMLHDPRERRNLNEIREAQKQQHDLIMDEIHYLVVQLLQIENPI